MPEMLNKSDVMRIINSENAVVLCCTRLRSADEVLFSIASQINSLQTIQTTIEADIDRAEILRLCNEIEDIVSEISKLSENYLIYSDCKSILDRTKAIAAEITEPPKTNADRIRQMTDEELAEFFCQISQCCGNDASCSMCPIYDGCAQNVMYVEKWLKQEVSEDACD